MTSWFTDMTTVVSLHPFLFDHDFDAGDAATTGPATAGTADVVRASEIEQAVAEARAEGFADGRRSGLAEASAAVDHHVARALEEIANNLAALGTELQQQEEDTTRRSAALAVMICRKFLPSRYRETAADEITALLAALLPRVVGMPKLTVRVAENLAEPLVERLREVARAAGFSGPVETIGDGGVEPGDCRIEWLRGGVVRDAAALWREVDALSVDVLGAVPSDPSLSHNPLQRVSRDA